MRKLLNKKESLSFHKIEASETWELRHRVMWSNKPLEYVKLPEDEKGIHFGLKKDEKLISVVSLFIENNQAQFRKFACEISEQNKGYGSKLLRYMFEQISNYEINRVWCNARINKTSYYKKFRMKETNQTFTKGGIDYVIMEKMF